MGEVFQQGNKPKTNDARLKADDRSSRILFLIRQPPLEIRARDFKRCVRECVIFLCNLDSSESLGV